MKRTKLIMELAAAASALKNDDDFIGSNPPRSVPPEIRYILDSDNSDLDLDFEVEKDVEGFNSSSDYDTPQYSRKRSCTEPSHTLPEDDNTASDCLPQTDNNDMKSLPKLTKRGLIRKRGLKGETRKTRDERKLKRNSGREYYTSKGKLIALRNTEPLGSCRKQCCTLVTDSDRTTLFKEYWELGDYDKRMQYIGDLLSSKKIDKNKKRGWKIDYNIEISRKRVNVCKSCFLKIFGETRRFLATVINKKQQNMSGTIGKDNRGTKE